MVLPTNCTWEHRLLLFVLCTCCLSACHIFAISFRVLSMTQSGNVVGIATGYGLDGPGIESQWGVRFSAPVQTGPGAHLYCGYRLFPGGVQSSQGMMLTPHPLLVPWSRKGRAIPLLPLWVVQLVQSLSACTRVHFTLFFFTLPWHNATTTIGLFSQWLLLMYVLKLILPWVLDPLFKVTSSTKMSVTVYPWTWCTFFSFFFHWHYVPG
jgi:hypothetical protein